MPYEIIPSSSQNAKVLLKMRPSTSVAFTVAAECSVAFEIVALYEARVALVARDKSQLFTGGDVRRALVMLVEQSTTARYRDSIVYCSRMSQ